MRGTSILRGLCRGAAVVTVAASAAISSLAMAAPAQAADVTPTALVCDPEDRGTSWFVWSSVATPKEVTHATRYENGTGETMTGTMSAEHQTTITAGITITSGGGVSASIVVASLDAQTSYSLQAAGSVTKTYNIGVSISIPAGKITVAYGGTTKVTGSYTRWSCDSAGALRSVQTGTAKSWDVITTGGQRCDLSPVSSLASLAKSRYC